MIIATTRIEPIASALMLSSYESADRTMPVRGAARLCADPVEKEPAKARAPAADSGLSVHLARLSFRELRASAVGLKEGTSGIAPISTIHLRELPLTLLLPSQCLRAS
jgi:hypothetical protein